MLSTRSQIGYRLG